MDVSQLSEKDLDAILNNDIDSLSEAGLDFLLATKGKLKVKAPQEPIGVSDYINAFSGGGNAGLVKTGNFFLKPTSNVTGLLQDQVSSADEYIKKEDQAQQERLGRATTTGQKIGLTAANAIGQLIPDAALFLSSGGESAVTKVPTAVEAVKGLVQKTQPMAFDMTAREVAGQSAHGHEMTPAEVARAYATNTAMTVMPMGASGNLAKRVGTGMATQPVVGAGMASVNNLTGGEYQDPYDVVARGSDALVGGFMHGMNRSATKETGLPTREKLGYGEDVPSKVDVSDETHTVVRIGSSIRDTETYIAKLEQDNQSIKATIASMEAAGTKKSLEAAQKLRGVLENNERIMSERKTELEQHNRDLEKLGYDPDHVIYTLEKQRQGEPDLPFYKKGTEPAIEEESTVTKPQEETTFIDKQEEVVRKSLEQETESKDVLYQRGLEQNIADLERYLSTKQGTKAQRDQIAQELEQTKAELESLKTNSTTPTPEVKVESTFKPESVQDGITRIIDLYDRTDGGSSFYTLKDRPKHDAESRQHLVDVFKWIEANKEKLSDKQANYIHSLTSKLANRWKSTHNGEWLWDHVYPDVADKIVPQNERPVDPVLQAARQGEFFTAVEATSKAAKDLHTAGGDPVFGGISKLMDIIKNNKSLKTVIDMVLSEKNGGEYNALTDKVSLNRGSGIISAAHEFVHAVTSRVLLIHEHGNGVGLNLQQKVAARKITELYNQVLGKHKDLLPAEALANVREFAAYGTTDPRVSAVLRTIRAENGTAFTKLIESIRNIFGIKGKDQSVLEQLYDQVGRLAEVKEIEQMKISNAIIDAAYGGVGKVGDPIGTMLARTKYLNEHNIVATENLVHAQYPDASTIKDYNPNEELSRTVNQGVRKTLSFDSNIRREDVNELRNYVISIHDHWKNKVSTAYQSLLHGDVDARRAQWLAKGKGILGMPLMKIHAMDDPKSFATWTKSVKDTTLLQATEMFRWGRARKFEYAETRKLIGDKYSPEVLEAFDKMADYYKKIYETTNKLAIDNGIKSPMAYAEGWYYDPRYGDHGVLVKKDGIPVKLESYPSKFKAEDIVKKLQKKHPDLEVEYTDLTKQDSLNYNQFKEELQAYITKKEPELANRIADFFTNEEAYQKVGAHAKYRSDILGSESTKEDLSPAERARVIRESFFEAANDYEHMMTKRLSGHTLTNMFLDTALLNRAPHKMQVAMEDFVHLTDRRTENIKMINQAARSAEYFADKLVSQVAKVFGKDYVSNKGILKTANDNVTSVAFMGGLINRMAFIFGTFGQFGQGTWANAMMEGANKRQASLAILKGLLSPFGMHTNPELMRDYAEVVMNSKTFSPNWERDMLPIKVEGHLGSTIVHGVNKFSLNAPVAWAEGASRMMAFSAMWHLFHAQGVRGDKLRQMSIRATNDIMYVYSKHNQSDLINGMGTLGDIVKPLTTFGAHEAGMQLRMMKYMKNTGDASPFVANVIAAIMIGGGIAGVSQVADMEALLRAWPAARNYLRQHFDVNSPYEWLMRVPDGDWGGGIAKTTRVGLIGQLTGIDLMSSTRSTGLSGYAESLKEGFSGKPFQVQYAGQMADAMYSSGMSALGRESREVAALKTRDLNLIPMWKSVIDYMFLHGADRTYVPNKDTTASPVRDTWREKVATAMGTRSIKQMDSAKAASFEKTRAADLADIRKTNSTIFSEGIDNGEYDRSRDAIDRMYRAGILPSSELSGMFNMSKNRIVSPQEFPGSGLAEMMSRQRKREMMGQD